MAQAAFASLVTKELCAAGGSLELGELARRLPGGISEDALEKTLRKLAPGRFVLRTRGGSCEGEAQGGGGGDGSSSEKRVLVAASGARLCQAYSTTCDGFCGQLHLCKFFLYGNCRFSNIGKQCKYSHSIDSIHNTNVLKSHGIGHLNLNELSQLLLQNDSTLLPEICVHYNKGDGQYGSCTFKNTCAKLHLCHYYLQGNCKFGSSCKRSHVFNSTCQEKLGKWGLSAAIIKRLPSTYRNAFDIKNESSATSEKERRCSSDSVPATAPKSDEENDQICLYHIRKACSFKDKCFKVHFHLPYRWQFLDGKTWKDLEEVEEIEKAYCDPSKSCFLTKVAWSPGIASVNFDNMTCAHYKARRLSTASSVVRPPHFILTTEWLWYWKNDRDLWQEYGLKGAERHAADVSSSDVEKAYLSQESPIFQFSVGKHNYELNFKAMTQKSLHYGTVRNVCRRPKYVSPENVKTKQTRGDISEAPRDIPSHWDMSALPDLGFKRILLSPSSGEYLQVQEKFCRTMPKYTIHKIERIQNPTLWEVYQWQKVQMKKSNGGQEVDERFLFHGTSLEYVDAICHQNFDWRISGLHGTSYGKGSYFARDAAYSHHYSKPSLKFHPMFLARVLVGEFTRGSSSYLRPPPKEGQSNIFYNSCVNSMSDPSIFVVFEKHQIYPEYLIWY
ncbi:protein mono-ADP-ribosyltransferase PARP12 isoform X2 [Phascolarctos cinereus]|uniref:Poly [ADP-ribose] polymerase 12 isoform X2 n=1 Tax=Phascolarctos cinereus TaxID=38626 RepID=A0A6P5L5L5_PHACI|nr:poly [ADP-ribose] polymerase 12 isoform X2 [Phascolarctos cinereus]